MESKKWVKSPWIISIASALFSFILTIGYDFLKDVPILTTIKNLVTYIWVLIVSFFNFEIKLWWLLLGVLSLIVLLNLIEKLRNKEKTEFPTLPNFTNYKEGRLKKWRWTWEWKFNSTQEKWNVSNLTAHCPSCDTPLIANISFNRRYESYKCPRCNFHAQDHQCEEAHEIEAIIVDNTNRKKNNP